MVQDDHQDVNKLVLPHRWGWHINDGTFFPLAVTGCPLGDILMLISAPASLGSVTAFACLVIEVKGRVFFYPPFWIKEKRNFFFIFRRADKKRKQKGFKEHFTFAEIIQPDTCTSFHQPITTVKSSVNRPNQTSEDLQGVKSNTSSLQRIPSMRLKMRKV